MGEEEGWKRGGGKGEGFIEAVSGVGRKRSIRGMGDIEYCSVVKLLVYSFWRDGISRGGFEERTGGRNGRMHVGRC